MSRSLIYNKALNFSVRIVYLYKYMTETKKENIMSKQLLRCGTSIGANISEALFAESTADFVHKLSIAQKEANETENWLTLLEKTGLLSKRQYESITFDCNELQKMLSSIILTTKTSKKSP